MTLSLHDILNPIIPLMYDDNDSPEHFDWDTADYCYEAARKLFPKITMVENETELDLMPPEPGEIRIAENRGFREHLPTVIKPGSPLADLVLVSALIIATHEADDGNADIDDIDTATEKAHKALKAMSIPSERISLEDPDGLDIPKDLGEMIKDPKSAGWLG